MKFAHIAAVLAAILAVAFGAPTGNRDQTEGTAAGVPPTQIFQESRATPHQPSTLPRNTNAQTQPPAIIFRNPGLPLPPTNQLFRPVPVAPVQRQERSVDERHPKRHRSHPELSGETISDQATAGQPAHGNADSRPEEKPYFKALLENWRQGTRQGWLPINPRAQWVADSDERQWLWEKHEELRQAGLDEGSIKDNLQKLFATKFPESHSFCFRNNYRAMFEADGRDVEWTKELDSALVAFGHHERQALGRRSVRYGQFAEMTGLYSQSYVFEERYRRLVERFGRARRNPRWVEPEIISPSDPAPIGTAAPISQSKVRDLFQTVDTTQLTTQPFTETSAQRLNATPALPHKGVDPNASVERADNVFDLDAKKLDEILHGIPDVETLSAEDGLARIKQAIRQKAAATASAHHITTQAFPIPQRTHIKF